MANILTQAGPLSQNKKAKPGGAILVNAISILEEDSDAGVPRGCFEGKFEDVETLACGELVVY